MFAGGVGRREKLMGRLKETVQVKTEGRRPLARKSPKNEGSGDHDLEKLLVRLRVWTLALLVCVVACASPETTTRDTPVAGEEPPPRFVTGGPDTEEFGASMGYPKGNPATFWRPRWQSGSFSHFDEIFRGRLIHKAPSRPSSASTNTAASLRV